MNHGLTRLHRLPGLPLQCLKRLGSCPLQCRMGLHVGASKIHGLSWFPCRTPPLPAWLLGRREQRPIGLPFAFVVAPGWTGSWLLAPHHVPV